jgi:hypothetical protein
LTIDPCSYYFAGETGAMFKDLPNTVISNMDELLATSISMLVLIFAFRYFAPFISYVLDKLYQIFIEQNLKHL